jgi:predicted Fe-Mo cluster-binding NifX family protein
MILAITSTGTDTGAPPSPTFGRCPYFLRIDTETMKVEALRNPGADADEGAGILAGQFLANLGVPAVLTGRVGPNAMEVLGEAGIRVYDIGDRCAEDALRRYREHGLPRIRTASPPLHRGRGTA